MHVRRAWCPPRKNSPPNARHARHPLSRSLGSRVSSRRRKLQAWHGISRHHAPFAMAQPGGISRSFRPRSSFERRTAHRRANHRPPLRGGSHPQGGRSYRRRTRSLATPAAAGFLTRANASRFGLSGELRVGDAFILQRLPSLSQFGIHPLLRPREPHPPFLFPPHFPQTPASQQ